MVRLIDPKVEIIDHSPVKNFESGNVLSPDELVYGAAQVTYQDMGVLNELIELKKTDPDFKNKIKGKLTKVAGAGHASMATTPTITFNVNGSSKLVDSIFTGARFGSFLMPSGRRVPITKDAITVPKGIRSLGKEAEKIFVETSEKNIETYEELQARGVPKQEASKIVQYGHSGGGVFVMPLETIIHFAKEFEADSKAIPLEGKEVISQLEDFIHNDSGMKITYEARKAAPRTGAVNPNIFHFRKNFAEDFIETHPEMISKPKLISNFSYSSIERDLRIYEWLKKRDEIFKDKEKIKTQWPSLLRDLEEIVVDWNDSINFKIASNIPWRVWGEVKRHRTMPQTTESVYHAVNRAIKKQKENLNLDSSIVSLPPTVKKDIENLNMWKNAFENSLSSYERLIKMGALESDVIGLIPRGLKISNVKTYDLSNLVTGYGSLRLCSTAEPEMKRITLQEMDVILNSKFIPQDVKKLVMPKCGYVGFCPEQTSCGYIKKFVPEYGEEVHKEINTNRNKNIKEKLK